MNNNYKALIIILSCISGILALTLCCMIFFGIKRNPDSAGLTNDPSDGTHQTTEDRELSLTGERPTFIDNYKELFQTKVNADVPAYTVDADLGNLINQDLYYFSEEQKKALSEDYFYVSDKYGDREFFEIYEHNRYFYKANFVTVDSLMHTYHLYFSCLLKQIEKESLADRLAAMSTQMQEASVSQYESLKGTEWEAAAKRNIAFFTVGACLNDPDFPIPDYVADIVKEELSNISSADSITVSALFDHEMQEDYTQYIPRGYYEGDKKLEIYFRTMMWYGRMHFSTEEEESLKSAALMSLAIHDTSAKAWEDIYQVTSFFAGASDDLSYYELYPLLCELYGNEASVDALAQNKDAVSELMKGAAKLRAPQINSIPIEDGEESSIPGFRFMGQRFTIDAAIMQQLIYSAVGPNSQNENRMLPDVLDAGAALGSDTALAFLEKQKDTDYQGYTENLNKLREKFSENNEETQKLFSASLYANWLNTLRPLLNKKGEGYPMFMQSEKWAARDLECFAGSYAELKHDTILYSKQVYAEMGDGDIPVYDDRGYVQPEPIVYSRFAVLARATKNGLEEYGMLNASDAENLDRLAELADKLQVISEKELKNETLSDEEYDLIREYGGNLEHFWRDVTIKNAGTDDIHLEDFPSALVVDIATDPNGQVLELGTGYVNTIYVVVPVDGTLKIASGSVYSFYQFPWPMTDRLTDSKWRQMMGLELMADGSYNYDTEVERPWWTREYRIDYEW